MMFVSENHGYVTVCHGDDFISCGSAAALDEVDRVLTAHFDTKILPQGKHLGRTMRWSPQGFEWESNSKHVEDMVELCGLKLESKGAPTPITKATGRGRRDITERDRCSDFQTSCRHGTLHVDRSSITPVCGYILERLGCSDTKQTRRHCICTRTRLGSRRVDHELCIVHCEEV